VPVNATSDGQFDPTLIPAEQIAEIKLVTGTGSVLYGPAGLAGSINIITRSGGGPTSMSARGEWRDGGAWLGRATASGGSGSVRSFAGVSATSVDGVIAPAGSPTLGGSDAGLRVNSRRERVNLGGHVGTDVGTTGTVGLTFQAVSGERGIPPSVIDDPTDPFANRAVFERVEDTDGLGVQAAGSFAPAPGWIARGWAYRNLVNELTVRYADAAFDPATVLTELGTSRDRSRSLLSGAAAQLGTTAVPLGRLTLGLTAERSRWEQGLLEAAEDGGGGGGGGGGSTAAVVIEGTSVDRAVWQYGAALEYEARPAQGVGATAGVVYRRFEGEGREDDAAGVSLGAYADVSPAARVRAAYGHRFRFPTLRQLFDAASGNPTLEPESADVYELGADLTPSPRATIGVTLFRADARNFIERPQDAPLFENAERYRFSGMELEVTGRPAPRLFTRARYTWLDAEDRTPGREGLPLQYRPRHVVSGEIRYGLGSLTAAGTLQYVAGQVYETRREPLVQADLPDFALVGLRLAQRLGATPVAAFLGVDNLLDEAYEQSYGFPQAGRTVYLGLDLAR
jgi:outer membrane receptor protein involved in Fe transport